MTLTKEEHLQILEEFDKANLRPKRYKNPQFQVDVFDFYSDKLINMYRFLMSAKKMYVFNREQIIPRCQEFDLTKEEVEQIKRYF